MKRVRLFLGLSTACLVILLVFWTHSLRHRNTNVVSGAVRIQAFRVAEEDTTVHWRWIITGDRIWTSFQSSPATSGGLQLVMQTEPNLLKQFVRSQGSSVLHCELTLKRESVATSAQAYYTVDYEVTCTSGNGPVFSYSHTFSAASAPANKVARVMLIQETVQRLLAMVHLATVSGQPVSIRFSL